MNMFLKICASALLIGISSSTFADIKFNNDLVQIIECKKSNRTYNDFLLGSEELLKKKWLGKERV